MVALNDPVEYDEDRRKADNWTPARGLRRAVFFGLISTLVITAVLFPVAWYTPHVLLNLWVRGAVAFLVAWLLFSIVQRAAGMVGAHCSTIAIGYTLLVLASHHIVFAVHGVATDKEIAIGWGWFHPWAFVVINSTGALGVGMCALMRHRGEGGAAWLAEILGSGIWGSRR